MPEPVSLIGRLRPHLACAAACAVALLVATTSSGQGATGVTVIGATVPSATSLDASGCASGTANVTSFGMMPAASNAVTSSDCVVTFGSSNDTARLRVQQTDNVGDAMYQELGGGGVVDPGFAGAGMFVEPAISAWNASVTDSSGGIARQSTGRFLVAGESGGNIVVRRYLPDGTLDGGFGPVSVAPCGGDHDVAGIVVASDDSFYIGGDSGTSCPTVRAWAMRFTPSGARDMTYGGDGIADTGFGSEIRDLAVLSTGSLVLVGGIGAFDMVRLTPTGAADTAFSGDGFHSLAGLPGSGELRGVDPMTDGSVVVSGYVTVTGVETLVARVLPSAAYHATFGGGDGWEVTNFATDMTGRSLSIGRDGSIFVGAYQGIVKFTSGGLLDGAFATGGVFNLAATQPLARLNDVVVQYDGSIVGFGQYNSEQVVAVRLLPAGSMDTSFGTSGMQIHDPAGTGNSANRAAWTEDGDLLLMGAGASGASIVRLDGLTVTDYDNAAANWTTPSTNLFGACLASVAAGASALWTTDGACTVANGLDWNEITPGASPIARTTVTTTQGATVNLRFGFRTKASQRLGTYTAPITFSVVAPDA